MHDLKPFEVEHFDRWYGLWVETINARWAGPLADLAKEHATRMGGTLARRLMDVTWPASGEHVERSSAHDGP